MLVAALLIALSEALSKSEMIRVHHASRSDHVAPAHPNICILDSTPSMSNYAYRNHTIC
jgi:hypothetical protein